jgi:Flp pilus assembly protein CpaB
MREQTSRALAVSCGMGGFICLVASASGFINLETPTPVLRMNSALFAVKDIPAGTVVTNPEELFQRSGREIEGKKPGETIREYAQLRGKVLTRSLQKGWPCTSGDLIVLAPGLQPLTVLLKIKARNLGGFVRTNSRWDIICTVQTAHGRRSEIVLENVLLLAMDPADNGLLLEFHALLAVTAEQQSKLLEAQASGDLCPVYHPSEETPGQ